MSGAAGADVPRPAASIILLREGASGLEVLMLKRHGLSDAFGEAFVFPGGKVDAADAALDAALLDEAPQATCARLHDPALDAPAAVGLFVAAIREACEEAGVLVATPEDRAAHAAAAVRAGTPFGRALLEARVRLATSHLVPWARWITPVWRSQPKRFDARFFVARAHADAVALHDGRETVASAWLAPRAALARYWARDIALAPPQVMTLAHFARHASVDALLAEARARPPFVVQPHVVEESDGSTLCFPGDPAHPVAVRAMPGPLRLRARARRFEPDGGFDAFFA
jgi:8-oxo-dGTP pyrophosphatase MutT (NUDIX family)